MILKSVYVKGYKGFQNEYKIEFNENETSIIGDNFKGKTSIGEAVCWCFFGCNLFGNEKTLNIVNKMSDTALVQLEFYDNERVLHSLIRKKTGKETLLLLDGSYTSTEILSKFYGNKKIFLAIYNPYYFDSLEPKEQRELLKSVLPTIGYQEAFEMLPDADKEILRTPRIDLNGFIKSAREDIRNMDKEQDNLTGKMQYAKQILSEHIDEEKTFDKNDLLNTYEKEYEYLLQSINGNTKDTMNAKIDEIDAKIKKYTLLVNNLRNEYSKNAKILEEFLNNKTICPVCKNEITSGDKVKEIIENQNQILAKIKAEGEEANAEIKTLNTQRSILDIKCNKLNPNEKQEEVIKNVKEKIIKLKMENEEIIKHNHTIKVKLAEKEKANKDIVIFQKAIDEITNERETLKAQIAVAISLNNLIIRTQMDMVKDKLDKVTINFSKIDYETGEVKDDYKVLYENREFNILSLSEKIRASLEISNLINILTGLNIPTFIDNSESITKYNSKFSNQIIFAKVVKDQDLLVESNLQLVV